MGKDVRVLLVDDDVAFLKATSILLEEAGYEVFTAQDGRTGLTAAREHKPDVAVIDVIMGRPDEGFRLARAIHGDPELSGVKMVILTAVGERYQMFFEPDEQWLPVSRVLEKSAAAEELVGEISRLASEGDAIDGQG